MLNDTSTKKIQEEESEREKNKKKTATTTTTKTKPQQRKRNTKEKLSDNTVNRRRPGRKTTQPEGCIPTPEGDGAALEEVSGCISRRDTEVLALHSWFHACGKLIRACVTNRACASVVYSAVA